MSGRVFPNPCTSSKDIWRYVKSPNEESPNEESTTSKSPTAKSPNIALARNYKKYEFLKFRKYLLGT